jgi:hypothetical protein
MDAQNTNTNSPIMEPLITELLPPEFEPPSTSNST